jgi:serine/threonine-protein kinase
MKVCPNCRSKYPDDANFCPQETCATGDGPCRLSPIEEEPPSRYQLGALLGGGASGEVWQAQDTQTGEEVAYKIAAATALPTPAAVERGLRELKQLQRAQTPRIARIIDFGRGADGRLFVVTELVAGRPLDDVVRDSGPFPLDRAKRIVAQIGEALLEGQKVGVVHHDLAAKNVLLASGDDVKVINFVLPRAVADTALGVPEYLSPEQAEGKLVDQRSNTYSLGGLLMLMLTGEAPYSGADPASVLQQVARGEVTPPSRRRTGLGAEVDRVVMKAMEKSSSRRPLTLRQFLGDVAALSGSPSVTMAMAAVPVAAVPVAAAGAVAAAPVVAVAPAAVPVVHAPAAFAKTMMFAGGAPEVPRLASQAAAARAEANGAQVAATFTPPAVTAAGVGGRLTPAPAAAPTPAPIAAAAPPVVAKRTHGAAIAPTMMAAPSANPMAMPGAAARVAVSGPPPAFDPAMMQPTPPPMAATPPPVIAASGGSGSAEQGSGGNAAGAFRETLWFKKGDVEQMVAEAKAKVVASRRGGPAVAAELEAPLEDAKPLEDRYVDDGSVTVEDRKKFSLRRGATSQRLQTVGGVVPGERMSEAEMIEEIGGGKRTIIIVVAAAIAVALVAVVVIAFRGKSAQKGAAALTPAAMAAPAAAPPIAEPPAPTPPPAAAAAAAPAPEGAQATAEPAAAPAEPAKAAPSKGTRASKKHAAKKHAGAKRHR